VTRRGNVDQTSLPFPHLPDTLILQSSISRLDKTKAHSRITLYLCIDAAKALLIRALQVSTVGAPWWADHPRRCELEAPLHQHQLYLSSITNHTFSIDRLALAYLVAKMSSVVINSTLQSASLAGLSNVLAQIIQAYRTDKPFSLDYTTLLQFVIFSLLATPPNILWQQYLEERFPANVVDEKGNQKLHTGNTAVKVILDQTLGAVLNSYLFIAGIGALKGKDTSALWADCRRVGVTP
jgi:hypothetical protein